MKKVFITRRLPSIAKDILLDKFEVSERSENSPCPNNKIIEIVKNYDAILSTVSEKFDKLILSKRDKLKVISNYAVGLDNIDVKYAKSIGIAVYNTPDVVTNSTADLTFSILLSLIRRISQAQSFIKENKWKSWDPELFLGEELSGKVFGILGFGKIGQAVANRAIGFGLNIIYYDKEEKNVDSFLNKHAKPVRLDDILENSDYISIHLPLTNKTKFFINKSTLDKMKKKPIILNIARGNVVNSDDLLEALKSGKIRGAGLDVTSPEPLSGNHPLCRLDNCIIVPHIGTATKECRINMARLAAQNIFNHFS
ncbi:MAG: 2-hydroxyacid dehydrogenase [Promethearchaeota archaeon]